MSILSYISQSSRPKVKADIAGMQPYTSRSDEYSAAMRSAFRSFSTPGQATLELAINNLVGEEFARNSELAEQFAQRDLGGFQHPAIAARQINTREDFLPKYKNREEIRSLLAGQGMSFSDKIPIPEGGLTLERAKIYQMALEDQEADDLIMANARPGLASFGAQLGGGLVGSIADPINFIPFAGGLNRARKMAPGIRLLSREGGRVLGRSALIGAGEGMTAAAVVNTAVFPLANR